MLFHSNFVLSKEMSKKIKIMIAEDHTSVRQAYILLFKEIDNYEVIGEAKNGIELLKLMRKSVPDIVITDVEMPQMNGFELAKNIKKEFPNVLIIVLSMHYSEYYVTQMLINGANAFLPKACDIQILKDAIHGVIKDGYYFNKSISNLVISTLINEKKLSNLSKQSALNYREMEILKNICEGKTNKQIAQIIGVEPCTVDFHRQNINRKTNSTNVVELVKYAIKHGITSVD